MPIKFGGQTFPTFEAAVKWVMRKKGWTRERASAYVSTIERKEEQLSKNKRV